jgi:hypothetical protein
MILVTNGGDAHAAYRIARCLQRNYKRVIVFIPGWCKSAGTLLAVGAHELVVSDYGEIGPLDVQLRKTDEILEVTSGLTVLDALDLLQNKARETFENTMLSIKGGSSGSVTFKTASDIAANMTVGFFKEIYAQISPMHVGEVGRLLNVAKECGERLRRVSGNLTEENLDTLVNHYPDHGFMIDRAEVEELFTNVRQPSSDEEALSECLGEVARYAVKPNNVAVFFLSQEFHEPNESGQVEQSKIERTNSNQATPDKKTRRSKRPSGKGGLVEAVARNGQG